MKKSLFSIFLAVLFFLQKTTAQDCRGFMPASKNSEWEITSFDKKGLPQSITISRLVDLKPTATGFEASVDAFSTDEKGKDLGSGSYRFQCKNGAISMDMKNFLPAETLGAYQNMELAITGSPVEIPSKMVVGDSLPNAAMEIQVKSGSLIVLRLNFQMLNRKVLANEQITTTAGSFNCLKISSEMDVKMGMIHTQTSQNQWFSEGVGLVKSESFDKKGRLEGSQQLTKFQKG